MEIAAFARIFVQLLVTVLFLVVLGRILISWVDPRFEGSIARFLYETTEPMLSPIRRVLPKTGMFDLAPMLLSMVLLVLMRVLLR